ncbi:sigma-70 family RNA polymerase sigma factor [Pedobacter deserti]|uniref:sigma-70 family RNA polymerase sigma factor n=1 Tax=Pedobacter deserti TaxID=2817382 RepID=UPI002109B6C0|nr:sigma-70 family RNA polymerase sigma factor [Pedobacter sp. SYSU D00382]
MERASNYTALSDLELIDMLKVNDHLAYTEIYNRYQGLLIAFSFKKLQDEDIAKDLVQDLFVKLWTKRETLTISNLPGFLVTSMKNLMFNHFEHQQVSSKYIESLVDFTNTGDMAHADYLVREKEWQKHIETAIASLPNKMRKAFISNRVEYKTYAQTAEELQTTENNIQKHINSAIKLLKTRLTALL